MPRTSRRAVRPGRRGPLAVPRRSFVVPLPPALPELVDGWRREVVRAAAAVRAIEGPVRLDVVAGTCDRAAEGGQIAQRLLDELTTAAVIHSGATTALSLTWSSADPPGLAAVSLAGALSDRHTVVAAWAREAVNA